MAFVNLGQVMYPVGSIYMSTNPEDPGNLFGGGWARITGAVLRANEQNGVYTDSDETTLTKDQMPTHSHDAPSGYFICITNQESMRSITPEIHSGSTGYNGWAGHLAETASQQPLPTIVTGGNKPHTNKQRAYNIYAWQRTS